MKKRLWMLTVVLAAGLAAAGCGKSPETNETAAETPAPEEEKKPGEGELVEMQKIEEPLEAEQDFDNMIGTRTPTSSHLGITNQTGGEIAAIYIRPAGSGGGTDDWGEELVKGSFTLKENDEATWFFEKDIKDASGQLVTNYDIRIGYTDIYKNECFFRNLPLTVMTELRLCMDGTGVSGIPYARYHTLNSDTEYSTLEEVKKRLGLTGGSAMTATATPVPTPASAAGEPTPEPSEAEDLDVPDEPAPQVNPDPGASTAQTYQGQPLENLMAAMGSPSGSSYEDEPESGRTGYHYYSTFTVMTSVDDAGNETIIAVY